MSAWRSSAGPPPAGRSGSRSSLGIRPGGPRTALCWADRLGRPLTPRWRTADWGYLRFHEGAARPWPRYGTGALHSWLDRVTQCWADAEPVYVYFNNDQCGAAIADSAAFAGIARRSCREVTRTPAGSG